MGKGERVESGGREAFAWLEQLKRCWLIASQVAKMRKRRFFQNLVCSQ
jgi:hypothetical protein